MKIKALLCLPLVAAVGLAGCAASSGIITPTPSVDNGIQTAFTAICDPTAGLLTAAAPFATAPGVAPYYADAQQLCANGAPTNIIVGGLDAFDLYVDLAQALAKKSAVSTSVVAKAKHLRLSHKG